MTDITIPSAPFTKLALLTALAVVTKSMHVDGVGTLCIRQISVTESDAVRAASQNKAGQEFGMRLLIASVVDELGQPMFEEADLGTLMHLADAKISKIVDKVLEVNGYKKVELPNVLSSETTPPAASVSA